MSFPNHPLSNDSGYQNTYISHEQNDNLGLTVEEIRVISECNMESFYYRCVPLMLAAGFGAQYGVQKGYLKSSGRLKSIPNVAVSMILAFLIGKYSYAGKCEEKILALPGGKLKDAILKQKGESKPRLTDGGLATNVMQSVMLESDLIQETKSMSDLYSERPTASFYDTSQTYSNFGEESIKDEQVDSSFRSSSYDQLRLQNREEYGRSGEGGLYGEPLTSVRDTESRSFSQPKLRPQRKNLYGDVYEK